ncbi:MAG: hypothetical protein ACYTDV_17210, partial [Planctomycetota bacterium]
MVAVGAINVTSPWSDDAPPVNTSCGLLMPPTFLGIPVSSRPISRCKALANSWSCSLHSGMPISSMF